MLTINEPAVFITRFFLGCSFLFCTSILKSQTFNPSVTFQTPEVAAFNRNIETPVSYFTGIPSINIPLYVIRTKDFTLPVTLNYVGGGIKVEEEATWVGLGWKLNYGGTISRKQRGLYDEQVFMRPNSGDGIASYLNLPQFSQDPYLLQRGGHVVAAKNGLKDYMPDEFFYNALDFSGKFMFNQVQNKFVLFPKEDIKIDYSFSNINGSGYPTSDYYVDYWNVTLPNATVVQFGTNDARTHVANTGGAHPNVVTAWNIKSIQSYRETINFQYDILNYAVQNFASETFIPNNPNGAAPPTSYISSSTIRSPQLNRISFPGGYLEFIGESRLDMPGNALKYIYVKSNDGSLIKTIEFVYGYFSGTHGQIPSMNHINENYRTKRLRLEKLIIKGNSNLEQPLEYTFSYNYNAAMLAPSKHSYAQDFWGFFNGTSNTTLLPRVEPFLNSTWSLAERRPNPMYNQIFSLKSIRYPEGGTTDFEYECNTAQADYAPSWFLTPNSSNFEFYTAGTRVKSIKYYNGDGNLAFQKKYSYNNNLTGQKTTGRLLTLPKFSELIRWTETTSTGTNTYDAYRLYNNSRIPLGTTSGSFLGYERVTEETAGLTTKNNLKTIFNYPFWDGYYNLAYSNPQWYEPYIIDGKEWKRGKPSMIEYYRNDTLVKLDSFGYHQISPHLNNEINEDFVDEINTDLISWRVAPLSQIVGQQLDFIDNSSAPTHKYNVAEIPPGGQNPSSLPYFKHYTGFDKALVKKTTLFEKNNMKIEETEIYSYNTPLHNQVVKTKAITSTQDTLMTIFKYPIDFTNDATYAAMVQKNNMNVQIEKETYKKNVLLEKIKNNYSNPDYPDSQLLQIGAGPLETKASYFFDVNKNLKEIRKSNDISTSYIWDEAALYPVAEIINARAEECAYTSFESNTVLYSGKIMGGWIINYNGPLNTSQPNIPMGVYCFPITGSNTISKIGLLADKRYKISYWSTNGACAINGTTSAAIQGKTINGWTNFIHTVFNVSNITISSANGYIDELRLYPDNSHVTTYSYTPLLGIDKVFDQNNKSSTYVYNSMGELWLIKDEGGNVVKRIDKKYNQQITNPGALFGNTEIYNEFTKNCSSGGIGSTVVYRIPANTFTSNISQQDADVQALNSLNQNGQSFANTNGTCTFKNSEKVQKIYKNNCSEGYMGTRVKYTVSAGTYTSSISQSDADQKAEADIVANGQTYANSNGSCVVDLQHIITKYSNQSGVYWQVTATNVVTNITSSAWLGAGYSGALFNGLAKGNYTITISASGQSVPYATFFSVNDTMQQVPADMNGTTIVTFNNIEVNASSTDPLIHIYEAASTSCGLTAAQGWQIGSNNIYAIQDDQAKAYFYLTFNNNSGVPVNWGYENIIATISGSCTPNTTRIFNYLQNDNNGGTRTWEVRVYTSGQISVKLIGGYPPSATDNIYITGYYNL